MTTNGIFHGWLTRVAAVAALGAALGGCANGGGGGGHYTLGGTVSGLTGTVVLRVNSGDELTVGANGPFTFTRTLKKGQTYVVTVLTQPAGLVCNVQNGGGQMPAANVSDVVVSCGVPTGPGGVGEIGGTITGLTGTVTMNFGYYSDDQTFDANGPFAFAELSAFGNSYEVTITAQPAGQVCSVANGFGVVLGAVTNVQVNCVDATATFAVGGTISGLHAAGLVISGGAGNSVSPAADATTFVLPQRLGNTGAYDVGIAAQPAGETCVIGSATGKINAADADDIDVQCIDNVTDPLSGTYTAPGLQPGSYVYVTLFPDGVYIFGSIEDNLGCNSYSNSDGNGVEYGVYRYDAATHAFTIRSARVDTNGYCGLWDDDMGYPRFDGTLTITGSGPSTVITLTPGGGGTPIDLVPVPSVAGEITGSWAAPNEKNVLIVLPDGGNEYHYLYTETQFELPPYQVGITAGVEYACASVTTATGGFFGPTFGNACAAPTPTDPGSRDTNGRAGFSWWGGSNFAVTGDTLDGLPAGSFTRVTPP